MKTIQALPLMIIMISHVGLRAATLDVDHERSRIQVDAKATGHSFTGTLEDYSTTVKGDAGSVEPQSFDLSWSFKDLKTADEKRDKEMLSWLGGGDPKGSFHFDKSWVDDGGVKHAMGKLTIKGVSKTISFPFKAEKDGEWVTIDGNAKMNYEDFKLPIIRSMAVMTVDPHLTVRFHLVGKIK